MMRLRYHVWIAILIGFAWLGAEVSGQVGYHSTQHPVGWGQAAATTHKPAANPGFFSRSQPPFQTRPGAVFAAPEFGAPQYGTATGGPRQFDAPQPGRVQPQYGQPHYGQAQYGQPQFGLGPHRASQHGPPQYGIPRLAETSPSNRTQPPASFQYPSTLLAPFQKRIYGYEPNRSFQNPDSPFTQAGFQPQTHQRSVITPQASHQQPDPQLNYQEGTSPSDRAPLGQQSLVGGHQGHEILPEPESYSNSYQEPSYDPYQGYGGGVQMGDHQAWCNGGCQGACMGSYDVDYFGPGNPYVDAMQGPWNSACHACGGAPCHCRRRLSFFGGIAGLVMTRDYESNVYLSYYDGDPRSNNLTSRSAELGSQIGYEATLGTCFGCGWAVVGSYWGLAQEENSASVTGRPYTRLFGTSWVDYTPQGYAANSVYYWFNGSQAHRVTRQNEFHNVEINFMHAFLGGAASCGTGCGGEYGGCGGCGDCCEPAPSCWNVQYSIGARYFKFDEFFQYASSWVGGYTYAPRELFYDIETTNNLLGIQFGGLAQRAINGCFSVYAGTKIGFFNNRINHHSHIYGPSGSAVVNTGSYANTAYNVASHKDDLAVLGELNLGMRYQFSNCLRGNLGYRALAVTGVALAPDQIPNDFSYIPGVRYIDSDGSLLLHGLYAGIEFRR